MKTRTAKSISEVLEIIGEARSEWKLDDDEEMWFRGEDAKHIGSTLQPKLYRHLPPKLDLVSKAILKKEKWLHGEFSRNAAQLYDRENVDDWDWHFLMQHHGAPTRLLDWSDGALMSLHFAVNGNIGDSKGGFVYLLDPYQLLKSIDSLGEIKDLKIAWRAYRRRRKKADRSWPREWDHVYVPGSHSLKDDKKTIRKSAIATRPDLPNAPLVVEFPHITRRVAAQRSRFIMYGRDKNWLTRWAKAEDSRLWRIFIPKTKMLSVRAQLRDAGVTESAIFPDLDGLGRELDQLWNTLKMQRSLAK